MRAFARVIDVRSDGPRFRNQRIDRTLPEVKTRVCKSKYNSVISEIGISGGEFEMGFDELGTGNQGEPRFGNAP